MASRTTTRRPVSSTPTVSSRERVVAVGLLGAVVGAALVGVLWLVVGSGSDDRADDPTASRVADLEAERFEREAAAFDALVETAESAIEGLLPVLSGMAAAMPLDGTDAAEGADARPDDWVAAADAALADLEASETGGTATNRARLAFIEATRLLGVAAETYADGDTGRAAQLRTSAAEVWSIGAIALDETAVLTDQGHIHLFLPLDGSEEGVGVHH
ncbi:hypothetical protein [Nocardioides sp. SYSU D00038]|uniref:hypothetical protein n=1 Tax=Nocardioides sp. SYSU D00038 TaxID=2812554 RepID=UPI001967091F|nr:hypothetical protein [Nocardioides sp. SYSU D00038]